MLRTPIIRSFLAGIICILFAFSITPKRWLHNVVATHKDGRSAVLPLSDTTQLGKATFNCPCDNFIAESPFLHFNQVNDFFVPFTYAVYQAPAGNYFIASASFCFGLRGPPAC